MGDLHLNQSNLTTNNIHLFIGCWNWTTLTCCEQLNSKWQVIIISMETMYVVFYIHAWVLDPLTCFSLESDENNNLRNLDVSLVRWWLCYNKLIWLGLDRYILPIIMTNSIVVLHKFVSRLVHNKIHIKEKLVAHKFDEVSS